MIFWVLPLLLLAFALFALHRHFHVGHHGDLRSPRSVGLSYEAHRIPATGRSTLSAWWVPADAARATAVILHGWGSGKAQMLPLAVMLNHIGFNVLLLDSRNHGDSDRNGFSSLPRFAEDLAAALDWLQRPSHPPLLPIFLVGHSVGAGAVLLEAGRRDDVAAVVSLSAFAHPQVMMCRYMADWPIPACLKHAVLSYVQWVIGFRFDDIAPQNTIRRVNVPVLLVHGDADLVVPPDDATRIFEGVNHPFSRMHLVAGAGHDYAGQMGDRELQCFRKFAAEVLASSSDLAASAG